MQDRDLIRIAASAWLIGLATLLCDHYQSPHLLVIGLHTLFAGTTCLAICLVLLTKARALAEESRTKLYATARLVSRWVYISLYGLALIRMILYVDEATHTCLFCQTGAVAFPTRPLDDFQFYIACCVIPLWVARTAVLAGPLQKLICNAGVRL